MKSVESISSSKTCRIAAIVAAAVALAGVALWVYQHVAGDLTNMGNASPWGVYIMGFMFMVGVAAGCLAVASVPRIAGLAGFESLEKPAAWTAVCAAVLAIGFVLVDLGGPLRVWELFVYSNFSSPLMWDIFALPLFLIVAVAYLWTLVRAGSGKVSARGARIVAVVALVVAVVLCAVDAWIFGLLPGRVMWSAPLLPVWFVISALASGMALMMIVSALFGRFGIAQLDRGAFAAMAKCLGVVVIADLLCLVCDLVGGAYAGGHDASAVQMLLGGAVAPVFWIEVAAGVVAAALLVGGKGKASAPAVVAACLVLVSVFCKRIQFVIVGFSNMQAPFPGVATAGTVNTSLLAAPMYVPSPAEWGIVVALAALGVFLLLVGLSRLPLASPEGDR